MAQRMAQIKRPSAEKLVKDIVYNKLLRCLYILCQLPQCPEKVPCIARLYPLNVYDCISFVYIDYALGYSRIVLCV